VNLWEEWIQETKLNENIISKTYNSKLNQVE